MSLFEAANNLLDFICNRLDNSLKGLETLDRANKANLRIVQNKVQNIKDIMGITSITDTYNQSNQARSIMNEIQSHLIEVQTCSKNEPLNSSNKKPNNKNVTCGSNKKMSQNVNFNEQLKATIIKNLEAKDKKVGTVPDFDKVKIDENEIFQRKTRRKTPDNNNHINDIKDKKLSFGKANDSKSPIRELKNKKFNGNIESESVKTKDKSPVGNRIGMGISTGIRIQREFSKISMGDSIVNNGYSRDKSSLASKMNEEGHIGLKSTKKEKSPDNNNTKGEISPERRSKSCNNPSFISVKTVEKSNEYDNDDIDKSIDHITNRQKSSVANPLSLMVLGNRTSKFSKQICPLFSSTKKKSEGLSSPCRYISGRSSTPDINKNTLSNQGHKDLIKNLSTKKSTTANKILTIDNFSPTKAKKTRLTNSYSTPKKQISIEPSQGIKKSGNSKSINTLRYDKEDLNSEEKKKFGVNSLNKNTSEEEFGSRNQSPLTTEYREYAYNSLLEGSLEISPKIIDNKNEFKRENDSVSDFTLAKDINGKSDSTTIPKENKRSNEINKLNFEQNDSHNKKKHLSKTQKLQENKFESPRFKDHESNNLINGLLDNKTCSTFTKEKPNVSESTQLDNSHIASLAGPLTTDMAEQSSTYSSHIIAKPDTENTSKTHNSYQIKPNLDIIPEFVSKKRLGISKANTCISQGFLANEATMITSPEKIPLNEMSIGFDEIEKKHKRHNVFVDISPTKKGSNTLGYTSNGSIINQQSGRKIKVNKEFIVDFEYEEQQQQQQQNRH